MIYGKKRKSDVKPVSWSYRNCHSQCFCGVEANFLRFIVNSHLLGIVILNVEPEFAEVGGWQLVLVDLPVEDDTVLVLGNVDAAGDV